MELAQKVKKAMTKDEVSLLIDLIQITPILTSKETNASTNKSKDDAWTSLGLAFNARSGSVYRTKEQLKLKWDNLKKAARKRSQQIRMNNLKTGGGKPDFIPPDEILEKVTGLLGSTCTGYNVPFGGDGTCGGSMVLDLGGVADVSVPDFDTENVVPMNDITNEEIQVEMVVETPHRDVPRKKMKLDLREGNSSNAVSSKHFFGMPMSKQLFTNKKGKKVTDMKADVTMSTITRNLAIADYYDKKKEKINLEIKLLNIEIAQKENYKTLNDSLV